MFGKKIALFLYSSLFLSFSFPFSAYSSLLTDPDGLNVSLYNDGFAVNSFGPDGFTMGYDPGGFFGNTIPGNMQDETLMEVSFFESSISFIQTVTTGLPMPITSLGWTMTIDDIDWPDAQEIVSASIISSTYLTDFSVSFSANSLTIRYDGGDLIDTGDIWQGAITFDTALVEVPEPPVLSLLLLGCLGFYIKRKVH